MGLLAPRFAFAALLAVLVLALGTSSAHAADYDFSVDPSRPNTGEVTTFALITESATAIESVVWDLDGNGGFETSGQTVTQTYTVPGPVTVRMRVTETDGKRTTVARTVDVNGPPSVDFGFSPPEPVEGEDVLFTPVVSDPEGDQVTLSWSFGDGTESSDGAPSHAYGSGGDYPVVLTATDENGAESAVEHVVTVASDPGPSPAFSFEPAAPVDGDSVTFTSSSTASQGAIDTTEWDFDADGEYDDAAGESVDWTFPAGTHPVAMRVTQSNGKQAVAFQDVQVAERPLPPPEDPGNPPPEDPGTPPPGDPGTPPPVSPTGGAVVPEGPSGGGAGPTTTTTEPVPMQPFPVVRIAGVVLDRGARIRILSVRAPRGSRVRLRCHGRSCPARAVARKSATRTMRFHRFERRLRAGTVLELFVRKANRIGKYTRFLIRAGKPPKRVDRCLVPSRVRPVSCG